jgi:molybdenum cofactor biosynthesis protein B
MRSNSFAFAYNRHGGIVNEGSMSVPDHHRRKVRLKLAIITASDSRTPENDESGRLIREMLEHEGHSVASYEILPDTTQQIRSAVNEHLPSLDGVIITGGTGIAQRDSTIEAVRPLLDKELEGFGELFRMLSYQEVGSAALMSRALAGVASGKIVVALPGSPQACRLALEKLLLPELGHIAHLLKL